MAGRPRIALVLSGGGARGAYEVGVLNWIAVHRPAILEHITVITGSSVGAINGCFLASRGLTPDAVLELEDLWANLEIGGVLTFSTLHAARIFGAGARRLVARHGHSPATGFFETSRFEQLVRDAVLWDRIPDLVRQGRFDSVAVTATEIGSGGTHIFADHRHDMPAPRWPHDRSLIGHTARIRLEHVLASASIPFLFPPVRIGDFWYTDGGLRQNTPLSPALRLGADRLLVVALAARSARVEVPGVFPGLGQLLGKLFNSLFLDRMAWDLDRLDRINDLLTAGTRLYGTEFIPKLQSELGRFGRRPYDIVRYVSIRPGADVGMMAARVLREPHRMHTVMSGPMRSMLASDNLASADAASFVLFDGAFARDLMSLGMQDAAASATQLDSLLD
ncbi:MAG: patatin-like phospholipase family protein [Deltaproteobacteria bacterium]|nr:patatin-like phospholipase family protein [Deltaproteobacteria bacterium]MCB9786236.1 patatin-like phospholipase family protein [Deltaproteobacteria bacterium]